MARLARRMLLLTGVAEGLGAAIAETFAEAGHDVVGIVADQPLVGASDATGRAGRRPLHPSSPATSHGRRT